MIYGKVAQRLASKGYAVIPLKGKAPTVSKWELTTPETVLIDSKYDKYNIGLLCGSPSGVIVIDIDTLDEELEQKMMALLPDTPVMKKGKKGVNFFYKYNGEETVKVHNPINTRLVELELISTGRQTVIPNSIHPDSKKPYIWCNRDGSPATSHLLNTEKDSLPILDPAVVEKLKQVVFDHCTEKHAKIQSEKVNSGVAGMLTSFDKSSHKDQPDYNPRNIEDIPKGYVNRCRSGSHDAVIKYMMALINKGYNKEQVILEAMKYDQDYNLGYKFNYFTCPTNKAKGETPRQKAEYFYDSSRVTVSRKKEEAGEKMPSESDIIVSSTYKEMEAVNRVLQDYGIFYDSHFERIKKEDQTSYVLMKEGKKDVFAYDGKKWFQCQQSFFDHTYRRFNTLLGLSKTHNQIVASQSKFLSYVPSIKRGRSFYKTNPFMANFANGTLHLTGVTNRKLIFKPHSKEDFTTDIVNLDYGTDKVNHAFEEMLERITQGEMDKYHAIQEMFAVSLMPISPRVFFLYGVSGSGKSTIGKILSYLIGEDNLCGVDPSSFDGFNMESMVNKKVNMDMDISIAKPISDGNFKKIEDGNTVRIRRKGKEDIYANIPLVHIFGANTLPKNFDGASGAYSRRTTIVKFDKSFTNNGQKYDREYAFKVFSECPEGILNFAVKGLNRLIENGMQFTVPESGMQAMDEWMLENDPVGLFIEDLRIGEVSGIDKDPVIDSEAEISRADLWLVFEKWLGMVGRKNSRINRSKFYALFEAKGFNAKRTAQGRFFKGVGHVNNTSGVVDTENNSYDGY